EVNELPAPVTSNEHAGTATLLIHLSVLVLSLGGGTTGHDRGIAVDAHFDLVRHQRLEIYAPGFAVLEVLRPILDHGARALMDLVLVSCWGEGAVYRAVASLQRAFFDPPSDGRAWANRAKVLVFSPQISAPSRPTAVRSTRRWEASPFDQVSFSAQVGTSLR